VVVPLVGEKNGSVAGMKCSIVVKVAKKSHPKSKIEANIECIKR
jgi:hypothetical protein